LAATVQRLVSAASRVLISVSSTRSVLLASDRMLPVLGHRMTSGMISYRGNGRDHAGAPVRKNKF
jgi:hypothetical protein